MADDGFYLRYYVGHKANRFGHEFLEFEFRERDGRLRYANNSNYKGAGGSSDGMIRKSLLHANCDSGGEKNCGG